LKYQDIKNGRFYWEDCFDAMKEIPDGVIDMILCDLPYGTTQNKWDSVLPLDKLWAEYWRVCKSNAAVVLTAAQPFSSAVTLSQIDNFKYQWIWVKSKITGVLNAKKMPVRKHEQILVFYKSPCIYNAQGLIEKGTPTQNGATSSNNYGIRSDAKSYIQEFTNWPRDVLEIASEGMKWHPTQKPVALFEYLIKTYTNENELILDNTAGSGTTAIAAINTNRRWICIEKDEEYANKAIERINAHTNL
jgi:site-specific DNA-methyltransferase (adenine-specific)